MGLTNLEEEPWKAWKINNKVNPDNDGLRVPESCCRVTASGLTLNCTSSNPVDPATIYTADCFTEGLGFVKGHAKYLGGVAIGISFIMVRQDSKLRSCSISHFVFSAFPFQVLGMIFSFSLFKLIE